jgi:hypothetical protein
VAHSYTSDQMRPGEDVLQASADRPLSLVTDLPATLAEFGLGQWNNVDFYDISLVVRPARVRPIPIRTSGLTYHLCLSGVQDGYNLPLSITPSDEACTAPSCAADLNADCPAELRAVSLIPDISDRAHKTPADSSSHVCSRSTTPATTWDARLPARHSEAIRTAARAPTAPRRPAHRQE